MLSSEDLVEEREEELYQLGLHDGEPIERVDFNSRDLMDAEATVREPAWN